MLSGCFEMSSKISGAFRCYLLFVKRPKVLLRQKTTYQGSRVNPGPGSSTMPGSHVKDACLQRRCRVPSSRSASIPEGELPMFHRLLLGKFALLVCVTAMPAQDRPMG